MGGAVNALGVDVGQSGVKLACRMNKGIVQRKYLPREAASVDWADDTIVVERIRKWIETAGLELGERVDVVIGATGAVAFERSVSIQNLHIRLYGDVTIAARACGIQRDALLLMCGTGGALINLSDEDYIPLFTYGPVVGDRWGGLALGRLACRYLLDQWIDERDTGEFATALAELLRISDRREFLQWQRSAEQPYAELGKLGHVTLSFAERNHTEAIALVHAMLDEMSEAIQWTIAKSALKSPVPVGMQGRMVEDSFWLRHELTKRLKDRNVGIEVSTPSEPLDVVALQEAEQVGSET